MEDMDIVCHLLLTLPKSYDNLVTAIETMNPKDITIDFVKSRLIDELGKRNMGSSTGKSSESHAMNVKNPDIICFKCGQKGHIKSRCKVKKGNKSQKARTNFNKNGESANNASNGNSEVQMLCAILDDRQMHAATPLD